MNNWRSFIETLVSLALLSVLSIITGLDDGLIISIMALYIAIDNRRGVKAK